MYRYAMGKIAENLKHKSAYFSAHQIGDEEIFAYYEKTMKLICVEEGLPPITPTTVDELGNTILFHIIGDGVTMVLPLLVQMGYDPTHRNKRQEGLLHVTCDHCLLNGKPLSEVFEVIDCVQSYAHWNDEDKLGRTPLFNIVQTYERWKDMSPSSLGISQKRDLGDDTVALIEKAISQGANIHHRDHSGNTFVSKTSSACLAPFQSLIEKQMLQQHISSGQTRSVRKM